MRYVKIQAAELPEYKGKRVVLFPSTFDPEKIADRITYAAEYDGTVHGATRDGRFALKATSTVLVDPTT
ncbi:hypothetical protein RAE07_06870 [Corynebacterium kefirresidentii]|uniref:hypothetical protein n=1 Tax=Corynebacterium sp. CTNIH14 TaxID=3230065 RepID=UPI002934ABFD|nr:hypothetical protein [Corynebacterium kefirresidentii]MDV2415042.1 hypothetical protein [Corynebacterium kefirresidentii]